MRFCMTFIITVLGIGLVAGTTSAQDQIDYTEMVEDLKVMCRIVDETMEETFEKDYLKGGFFRRGSCQHLYLKGYGAVFLFDVQFPVAEKEMRAVKTKKKTNMWEKYEREVRHQNQPEETVWVVGKDESYNKEKVDKLKERIAYLVGEYGARIGQLRFEDTISFVVFGYSDHASDLSVNWEVKWHAQKALEGTKDTLQEIVEEAEQLLEAKQKLEGIAKQGDQDDDKKVIVNKSKAIIIEGEKDEKIEGSQPKKGQRFRLYIPDASIPPSLPPRFHGRSTTLILTFKRSQLEGKKGTDWEALLEAAEVVEY